METFQRYWPFARGIHRSPMNSPHKGQWRGALMFSVIYAWINGSVNNSEAGNLKRHRPHYDVIAMVGSVSIPWRHNLVPVQGSRWSILNRVNYVKFDVFHNPKPRTIGFNFQTWTGSCIHIICGALLIIYGMISMAVLEWDCKPQ